MKKLVTATLVLSILNINLVSAAEKTSLVDAGIKPDSYLYRMDRAMEDFQLFLTSDPKVKTELLLNRSKERLAEAKEMVENEKDDYVVNLLKNYTSSLEQAEDSFYEVMINPDVDPIVKDDLAQQIEETVQIDEAITEPLEEQQKSQLKEAVDQACLVANGSKDLDPEKVKALREMELGYGQIVKVATLSDLSGKSLEELSSLIKGGEGIGVIALDFGVKTIDLVTHSIKKKQTYLEEEMKKAKIEGNKNKVEEIEISIIQTKTKVRNLINELDSTCNQDKIEKTIPIINLKSN